MSKRITRSEKRKLQSEENVFFGLVRTTKHFFPNFQEMLAHTKDPRCAAYITYTPEELLFPAILAKATDVHSGRHMDLSFNTETCIENIYQVLAKERKENVPHHDTLNDYLKVLPHKELETVKDFMIKGLLKGRALEAFRLLGKWWIVAFDGTGLYCFPEKHCEHCLKRELTDPTTKEKRTIYMHHVLEAKLICEDMALSIGCEFIENEDENIDKQDCEIKAFYRLAGQIKQKYPRLPICILGDSLYACDPVFELCKSYGWRHLLRFKDGRIPTLGKEVAAINAMGGMEEDPSGACQFSNELVAGHRTVNYVKQRVYLEEKGEITEKTFRFLTDLRITKGNAVLLANAGRSRWKIENEGFNTQKNYRCHIEHVWCENYTAMKNHYLLAQIAEIIRQLYEKGSKLIKAVNLGLKEISSLLLESLRTRLLTQEDITQLAKPTQIRFT